MASQPRDSRRHEAAPNSLRLGSCQPRRLCMADPEVIRAAYRRVRARYTLEQLEQLYLNELIEFVRVEIEKLQQGRLD
jgi:hypothetical protein